MGEFAEDLFGSLIPQLWDGNLHGDDLITSMPLVCGGRHTLLPHPQLLSALGAGRDTQLGPAVDGWHLDLRSQCRFVDPDRHADLNVVGHAGERQDWARSE